MYISKTTWAQRLSSQQMKFIKSLRRKKYRYKEEAFVVEGAKNVLALLAANTYKVHWIAGTHKFMTTYRELLTQPSDLIGYEVSPQQLSSLGSLKQNQTALAVAALPSQQPPNMHQQGLSLVLDDIRDPGNLGTLLRIADWYGIAQVICSNSTVDLYNPKVIQASMGSFLHVKVCYTDLIDYIKKTTIPAWGADLQGNNLHQVQLPATGLVVIGNEARGISAALRNHLQALVRIPSYGHAESLNAAMAAAVICDAWRRTHL